MAFQIDPSIPLQANKVQFDPASIIMQAQQNADNLEKHRFEMQRLREQYDAEKEARKQQKQMQMGIAFHATFAFQNDAFLNYPRFVALA